MESPAGAEDLPADLTQEPGLWEGGGLPGVSAGVSAGSPRVLRVLPMLPCSLFLFSVTGPCCEAPGRPGPV